ncbi:MAG: hypothetical protein HQ508_04970 [Candidatus Marinimicrobia bacterium]|nr:hypothetical protein [Candidatus Neomarinimicrobiota bacterium]
MKTVKYILIIGLLAAFSLQAQSYGDPTFRKKGIHAGNKIRTVFFNYGLVAGTIGGDPEGEWPIGSGNMYIGDVSPLLGIESEQTWIDTFRYFNPLTQDTLLDQRGSQFSKFSILEILDPPLQRGDGDYPYVARVFRTFRSVGTSDGPRGWTDGPIVGDNTWTFEPVPGYANPDTDRVALSTDLDNDGPDGFPNSEDDNGLPDSWPPYWPDKLNDIDDPGWAKSWNGYFGKNVKNADQESYYVMDDNNDREFNYRSLGDPASGLVFQPDSVNQLRYGMGLSVSARGLQWSHFLAEDAIFWLYDVTNQGTTDYLKAAFGMMVGTLAGGRCGDSEDDLAYFDAENDITYSFDSPPAYSPCFDGPVGYAGYAFLESPGNPFDGIDNDSDNELTGSAPYFTADVFEAVTFGIGDQVVTIDEATYARSLFTLVDDTTELFTQGRVVQIIAGETVFHEDVKNLLDDNLNGLIDEDSLNHYANRIHRQAPLEPLLPLQYWDFRSSLTVTDAMLDEARDDGIDNDGDWDPTSDDVGLDGVPGTSDLGEGDGVPTSGYVQGADGLVVDTGLPGEPHVDKTDIDESDQIGLTSFTYFTPPGQIRLSADDALWSKLTPSIDVANDIETNPVDGDFIYGAGFFPLRARATERFSVGLVFGEDFDDILNNKITIQQIYDNNYNFAKPPEKPTVRAVPGDRKVTLYWNDFSEFSYDPVLGYDFEGYKIYRATDFGFNEINNITDGFGNGIFYESMEQFDLINDTQGFFAGDLDRVNGAAFYLGDNSGLRHSWTDSTVLNGQRYFYAVVAYDHGDLEKNIYPAECSKTILELNNQLTYDANTVEATPNARVAGFQDPNATGINHIAGAGSGTLELDFLDNQAVKNEASYELHFTDMSNDGIDNDGDWVAFLDIDSSGTMDIADGDTIIHDTGSDGLWAQNVNDPVVRKFGSRRILMGYYPGPDVDGTEGNGRPDVGEPNLDMNDADEMQAMTTTYSVFRETSSGVDTILSNSSNFYAGNSNYQYVRDNHGFIEPDIRPESKVVDGVRYIFNNVWRIDADLESSRMNRSVEATPVITMDINVSYNPNKRKIPHDYEIVFYDEDVDTSVKYFAGFNRLNPLPINFRVKDLSTDETMPLVGYKKVTGSPRDFLIYITHQTAESDSFITWGVKLAFNDVIVLPTDTSPLDTAFSNIVTPGAGDTLWVYTTKPFSTDDVFSYSTNAASVGSIAGSSEWKDQVRVVPNPYLAAASWEPVNRFATGRGERRVDFIHLPAECEIRLYTIRGDHIKTLVHDGNIFDGTVSWNLRTKEGLDIAYGIYIYHIDAGDAGETVGKLAIVK